MLCGLISKVPCIGSQLCFLLIHCFFPLHAASIATVLCDVPAKVTLLLDSLSGRKHTVTTIIAMEEVGQELVAMGKQNNIDIITFKDALVSKTACVRVCMLICVSTAPICLRVGVYVCMHVSGCMLPCIQYVCVSMGVCQCACVTTEIFTSIVLTWNKVVNDG